MNQPLMKARPVDFEEFGFKTMLECGDVEQARRLCALHLQAHAQQLQPEWSRIHSEILETKNRAAALHAGLYDRPIPVNDAAMLKHAFVCRIFFVFTILAAIACFVGNMTTFYLLGVGSLWTFAGAAGMTALPLIVGHLAYERIVASHRWLQVLAVLFAVALCFGGVLKLAEARRDMVAKAAATPVTNSYVDESQSDTLNGQEPQPQEGAESKIYGRLGEGMLLVTIAAELVLALLVGLLIRKHSDEDYAAWKKLKKLGEIVVAKEERISELIAATEIAKHLCMAGILRGQHLQAKRRPPYHRALSMLLLLLLLSARISLGQTIEHYEGILIDTSGSISRGGTTNELFHEYLLSTKKLLLTEPPNSRVWVSSISTDSFGGVHEILKGWTPDARGVFTDDLNRARRELATSFEVKSSGMASLASGTDIFGGLWRLKTFFELTPKADAVPKTIWIFSDMVNETQSFPMPMLVETGPERMLETAKANGLIVPLNGYKIHIYGVSPSGLKPQAWVTVKKFWTRYFAAAGAELVSYSVECDVQR